MCTNTSAQGEEGGTNCIVSRIFTRIAEAHDSEGPRMDDC